MSKRFGSAATMAALISLGAGASAQSSDRLVPASLQWKQIVPGAEFAAAYGDWEKGAHGKYVRFVKASRSRFTGTATTITRS